MSDYSAVPGVMVRMRVTRRFSHYNRGELIAVTLAQAQDLDVKRLATPLDVMVPTAALEAPGEATAGALRQPPSVVRK
jgi:hypothetical protein